MCLFLYFIPIYIFNSNIKITQITQKMCVVLMCSFYDLYLYIDKTTLCFT